MVRTRHQASQQQSNATSSSRPSRLLQLPRELLEMVMVEAMWACTLPVKEEPDLVSYRRRLCKHPTLQRSRIAALSQVCADLRAIVKSTAPASVWTGPIWRMRNTFDMSCSSREDPDAVVILPPSIPARQHAALSLVGMEAAYLSALPTDTMSALVELELSRTRGYLEKRDLESLLRCHSLRTLRVRNAYLPPHYGRSEEGCAKLLHIVAQLEDLQHLTLNFAGTFSAVPEILPKLQLSHWRPALTRLEVTHTDSVPFARFVLSAPTLNVAIFAFFIARKTQPSCEVEEVPLFPVLWRTSIHLCAAGEAAKNDASQVQLEKLSPLEVVRKAPALQYFDCSARLEIKTRAELDDVGELVDRDGWKRVRLRLETPAGNKGTRWTQQARQDVFIG